MLLEFSVENFLSFKERTTFSMVASKDKAKSENIINFNKINILKSAAIYGANASGKSNLIKALRFVDFLVRNSSNKAGEKIINIIPFKLDESCLSKPSSFELVFIKNNIKYIYGFSADEAKIYDEFLFYYPQKRLAKILKGIIQIYLNFQKIKKSKKS